MSAVPPKTDVVERRRLVQLDKEPAIIVREPDATLQPTLQDIQLTSKHRVLSFKPQLRLEWRGQDGQNETEQPDHSASLGDSITSSTQIRFSVHTGLCGGPICTCRYPDKALNRTAAPLVGYKRQDNVLIQTSCHSGHTAFSLP